MSYYLQEKSYMAVKPEASPGIPEKPSIFIPLLDSTIGINPNKSKDLRKMGINWSSRDLLPGPKEFSGDISILGDPKSLGHILNMFFKKEISSGDGGTPPAYTHPFTADTPKTYSVEIGMGGAYAKRFFGVMGDKLAFSNEDGRLKSVLSIQAMGMWDVRQLKTALTGAGMTEIEFDQEYSNMPNKGLAAGDIITVGGVDITITSVDAGGQKIGFNATDVTASIGDPVYLKAQTPSYSGLRKPLLFENLLVGIGATEAEATANATPASQSNVHEISMEISNNLLASPVSGENYGARIINPKAREGKLTIKRLFENVSQIQKFLHNTKQAATMIFKGLIVNEIPSSENLEIKLHNIKLASNKEPLAVADLIFDEQEFEILYDDADGKAAEINLTNLEDGSSY